MASSTSPSYTALLVIRLLKEAARVLGSIKSGEEIVAQGGDFGSLQNDTEIKADKEIGAALFDMLMREEGEIIGNFRLEMEGYTLFEISNSQSDRKLMIFIDPLDGSLNFRQRNGTLGLPISTCVSIFETAKDNQSVKFKDLSAAGVIDLRSNAKAPSGNDIWHCYWNNGNRYGRLITQVNGRKLLLSQETSIDLGKQIIIGEFYYPYNRELLCSIFDGQKGWLRNPGSAAYEMALVASGTAVAYICSSQKLHELGAAYGLVKGARGVVVDFDGNDIGEREYVFNSQMPVILAANQTIADAIVKRINERKS